MDVKFQKKLIELSFKAADEAGSEVLADIFWAQAARLQKELDHYLRENKPKLKKKKKK